MSTLLDTDAIVVNVTNPDAPFGGVLVDLPDSPVVVELNSVTDRVTSVFGRVGDILALQGDYSAFYAPLGGELPSGGTTGQILEKQSSTPNDAAWVDNPGGTPHAPTASVGLTVVNGSASTYMRSDAAPPIDVSINPTWSGVHHFTSPVLVTPVLGTPSSGTLTNCTGLPASGIGSGTIAQARLGSGSDGSGTHFLADDQTYKTVSGGSGTVTNTGGALSLNAVVLGAGTNDVKVSTGISTNGTGTLSLGVNTVTVGKVQLFGATSGNATIAPPAVAGTNTAITLPNANSTLPIWPKQVTWNGPTTARTYTITDATDTVLTVGGGSYTPTGAWDWTSAAGTWPTFNQNTTGSAAKISFTGQTGLMNFTGLLSTNRQKTVRDAADTILELGGSYTPTGTWTGMAMVDPTGLDSTDVGLASVTNDAQTKAAIVPNTAPSAGQILAGNAGGTAYAPVTLSGSGATATLSSAGVLTLSAIANASLANSAVANLSGTNTGDQTTVSGSAGSLKSNATTGVMQIVGPGAASTRVKTIRDADDTILELGGSYTPTGTWTSLTMVTPVLGTPTSGTLTNCGGTASSLTAGHATDAVSVQQSGGTGLISFAGMVNTNRIKTVRDAADTILELGGSYTPTGTWTSLTLVTPALGTPASGTLTSCTGLPIAGLVASTSTAIGVGSVELGHATDTTLSRSAAGVLAVEGIDLPAHYIIRAATTVTQANDANAHPIFTTPANGKVTLPQTGVYAFRGNLAWTSMTTTSGNIKVDVLGAGTATTVAWFWWAFGSEQAAGAAGAAVGGSYPVTSASNANMLLAATNTTASAYITGTFDCTGVGTIIPTQTIATAAACVLTVGSYIEIWRIGPTGFTSVGPWT